MLEEKNWKTKPNKVILKGFVKGFTRVSIRGFTLLEILAALAIASIGLVAVGKAVGSNIRSAQEVENRLIASWVASNRIAELRMLNVVVTAQESTSKEAMAGREWHVDQKFIATGDPHRKKVEVRVYTDPEQENLAAYLFAYLVFFENDTITTP